MDIGTRLREARQRRGITLRDISNVTKISMYLLEGIDRNDIARLPGGIFRRAYLRAYATEVGLNPEQVVSEYRAQFEIASEEEPLKLRPCHVDDPTRWSRWALLAIVAAGLAFVIHSSFFPRPAESPSALLAVEAAPVTGESDLSENLAPARASVPPAGGGWSVRLEIEPRGVCWVSATVDGRRVIYRLMQPGERATVEARDEIVLRVGDAGRFAYWIDGVPGRQLGQRGEAVTIHITEDNYRAFLMSTGRRSHGQGRAGTGQRAAGAKVHQYAPTSQGPAEHGSELKAAGEDTSPL